MIEIEGVAEELLDLCDSWTVAVSTDILVRQTTSIIYTYSDYPHATHWLSYSK